jgi:hypothetical protein
VQRNTHVTTFTIGSVVTDFAAAAAAPPTPPAPRGAAAAETTDSVCTNLRETTAAAVTNAAAIDSDPAATTHPHGDLARLAPTSPAGADVGAVVVLVVSSHPVSAGVFVEPVDAADDLVDTTGPSLVSPDQSTSGAMVASAIRKDP